MESLDPRGLPGRARGALQSFFSRPFGSALLGGLVVALLGWAAIETELIEVGDRTAPAAQPALVKPATNGAAEQGLTVQEIYERDAPGVAFVEAEVTRVRPTPFDLFPERERGASTGSGFVIDDDGHIVTNAHVVDGADAISVRLDDEPVAAELVGQDTSSDLALLKVDPDDAELHPLDLGDSSKVTVGDPVVAIGNPFGLDRTVTSGIVSALQRQIQAPNGFTINDVIQTDASINPGNSGGPLLDAGGRVIGINSQIATAGGGGSVGVGFAVPVNTARKVVEDLKESGRVKRAFLGIEGRDITEELAKAVNLPTDEGVLVQSVFKGSPADKAGLEAGGTEVTLEGNSLRLGGDIIVEFAGAKVTSMEQVVRAVEAREPGDEVEVVILRGKERETLKVKLGERPDRIRDQ